MKKVIKNYLACIILGAVSILAAILFAPIWNFWAKCPWKDWGTKIINILIAVLIICYLAFYLFKKIKKSGKRVIKVLTIVEFALLSLIALGCIFSQFKIINVNGACQIFALALWTRGSVELFRAYYYRADSKEVYPVWYLALSIAMVSIGAYCFAKPFISDIVILWIFVAFLLVLGLLLLVLGFNNLPKNKKAPAKKSK
jgi:hypothetical protein